MTSTEQLILKNLVELEKTVRAMPAANPKPNLLPLFTRLDELARQLPADTDSDLLHYLHRKSYEKARLWLQARAKKNRFLPKPKDRATRSSDPS